MKLLDVKHYDQLIWPLLQVKINNLFARAVIEKKVTGEVFVDNVDNPQTFYIVHPYGMSLLFGNSQNSDFNKEFLDYSLNLKKTRNKHIWLQAYPGSWDMVLSQLYGSYLIKSEENKDFKETGIIELNTRVNFKFNRKKYLDNKTMGLPVGCYIQRTDKKVYEQMPGTVIPSFFWNTADDFVNNGVGFSLFFNNKLATTAYSAFIHDNKLELGIETISEFRGRGFAQLACTALIDYSIENNYEPVWACRLENTGSVRLAKKLGFEISCQLPYYRLSK